MPAHVRRVKWSALTGMGGQCLFLLGFLLPYATLSTGQLAVVSRGHLEYPAHDAAAG